MDFSGLPKIPGWVFALIVGLAGVGLCCIIVAVVTFIAEHIHFQ
jgi:hypothetical protein